MRIVLALALSVAALGCGTPKRDDEGGVDAFEKLDSCSGLECRRVDCKAMGMPDTTVSGTVYAPNRTLALFNVHVYVPSVVPGKFLDGVKCDRCDPNLPGGPISSALSDEEGKFTLSNVPVGTDVPLIVTTGKWRRIVTIPNVVQCQDNPIPAELTSLPRNGTEGELPKIAISTGSIDALECLVKKIGVSQSEFTNDAPTSKGHVHLYDNGGADHAGTQALSPSSTLWASADKMKEYDVQLYDCEGSPDLTNKNFANMKDYADAGGRVFLEHYHKEWIEGDPAAGSTNKPAVWPDLATCDQDVFPDDPLADVIDQVDNPKGESFAKWMLAVGGSGTLGNVSVNEPRQSCSAIQPQVEQWVKSPTNLPQIFQFTTPAEADEKDRCGKIVFSDMHVSSGSSSSGAFPSGCSSGNDLSAQEKAIAFMFFDIASCIEVIN